MTDRWRRAVPVLIVAIAASVPLFWGLGDRYLWQDEAAAAVMGERLLRLGKPLAYDGRNLITMDIFDRDDSPLVAGTADSAAEAVRYYVERRDFKKDTTWIGQPWGQFVAAGLSFELFGKGTFQARLPFALMAVLNVVLLYRLVRRRFDDPLMAVVAVALLLANVYWLVHMRQCRYYAGSSLMLLVTLMTYLRWQDGKRFGAPLFVVAAWCLFQFDFGVFWPAVGVLFVDALRSSWPRIVAPLATGATLGLSVAPFVLYYEMIGRLKETDVWFSERFLGNLFLINQYVIPLLLLGAVVVLLLRSTATAMQRRILTLCTCIILAMFFWVPVVAPFPYHRYVVNLTPLACLLCAWVIARATESIRSGVLGGRRAAAAAGLAAIVGVMPLLSNVGAWFIPSGRLRPPASGVLLRQEWRWFALELAGKMPDPNREVIEYIAPKLGPGDEVLVNYEDIPFMFYTDARVRGGIPAFRVKDPGGRPPRFAVIRRSALLTLGPVFQREVDRYEWEVAPLTVRDVTWGNIPDPAYRYRAFVDPEWPIVVAERVDQRSGPTRRYPPLDLKPPEEMMMKMNQ